jgi:hypothetical protein
MQVSLDLKDQATQESLDPAMETNKSAWRTGRDLVVTIHTHIPADSVGWFGQSVGHTRSPV